MISWRNPKTGLLADWDRLRLKMSRMTTRFLRPSFAISRADNTAALGAERGRANYKKTADPRP